MKEVRLSAISTGHLYPKKYFWNSFQLQAGSTLVAGRIMSMKNSNDTIGNGACRSASNNCATAYPGVEINQEEDHMLMSAENSVSFVQSF
jgi:hypothetical protein